MTRKNEQRPRPTQGYEANFPDYPLWVRAVAGLIRLIARILLPGIGILRRMLAGIDKAAGPFSPILHQLEGSPGFYLWTAFLVALVLLGGFSILMSLVHSMEILEFYSNIPWVAMVSNYVFLIGSSVGLCMIAALGCVFGLRRYERVAKRALLLAFITVVCGLTSISLHLGHPERSPIYGLLTPNLRSAMAYMGILYPPYIVFLAVWYWLLARKELEKRGVEAADRKGRIYRALALQGLRHRLNQWVPFQEWENRVYSRLPLERMGLSLDSEGVELKWARIFGVLAVVFALLAYTVEGSLFAHVEARPLWYGPLTPIDFLLGAVFCGVAWLLAAGITTYGVKGEEIPSSVKEVFYEMGEILALLLSLAFLITAYKVGHGLFDPEKGRTLLLFLKGPFSKGFWLFEVGIGLLFPMAVLLYGTTRKKMAPLLAGAVMVLAGYFVKRYDFVVASQVYPLIKKEYLLPSYLPTLMEVLLIGGILGGLLLAYTMAVRFLPLEDEMPGKGARRT